MQWFLDRIVHNHNAQLVLTTIAIALAAGVFLIVLAKKLRIPAIVLLLAGGVALGPSGVGVVQPELLGDGMRVLVSLLVGVILFEGGLTLDVEGYRSAPRVIGRMLTVGVAVTWLGTTLTIWLLSPLSFTSALITASLVIVTGPTVIGPLLKRIRVNKRLHHILHWEGVLVDPIGVFIAIVCFDALALQRGSEALVDLALRVGVGLAIGLAGGQLLTMLLRRRVIPEDMMGVSTLAGAVALFGAAEAVSAEAGLLAVTAAGLWLGIQHPVDLKPIRHFKAEVTELSIGILFVLLSARLKLGQFVEFGLQGALIVAVVMLAVRPLAVMASTLGTDLHIKERLFLSWVAPRGIVAASMASLFAIELTRLKAPQPRFTESFTYGVIIATIVLQATSAGWVARRLGLERKQAKGWLIIGAHGLARGIAHYLQEQGLAVLLVDVNRRYVRKARAAGLAAVSTDAFDIEGIERQPGMAGVGQLLALTANEELNAMLCRAWAPSLGKDNCYRWHSNFKDEELEDRRAGQAVWTGIISPVLVGKELERGAARLLPLQSAAREGHSVHRLLALEDGDISIDLDGHANDHAEEMVGDGLCLEREASFFLRSLDPALVLEVDKSDSSALLGQMLGAAQRATRQPFNVEAAHREILAQEMSMPAALGKGIAVPHLFIDNLHEQRSVLARLKQPIDWFGTKVKLVLLLLSPKGDHERHLAVLADMARLLGTDSLREELLSVDRADMLAVLHRGPQA